MATIILASHGELSQGLKQTAAMIIGDHSNIYALSAFRDEDQPMTEQIQNILAKVDLADTYILTDILGGSVNNDLLRVVQEHHDLELIAGMNLPLVITLATQVNRVSQEELAAIIQESQQSIVNCKKLLVEATAEEDEL